MFNHYMPHLCLCLDFVGHATVSSYGSNCVGQAGQATARLVCPNLAELLGQEVAGESQFKVLVRQTFWVVSSPADECSAVDLESVSINCMTQISFASIYMYIDVE